jgi:hypothetical protein
MITLRAENSKKCKTGCLQPPLKKQKKR